MTGVTDQQVTDSLTSVVDVHGWPTTVRRAGTGRTVVFLHGAFFPTGWLPFHDLLAEHCDLVAPVLPGYLEGGPPDWVRGFDDLVLHVGALLDRLEVARFDLVGYDIGGWLAAYVAAFYPNRVRSLTAIAPMGLRVPEAPPMEWMAANPSRVIDALFNGDAGEHAGMFPPPSNIEGFVQGYGENGVTARLIWERRYDVRLDRRLANLAMPTHIVTPTDDRIVPALHGERWAGLVPGASLTKLDGVGHALMVQDPAKVARAVTAFIDSVPESRQEPRT